MKLHCIKVRVISLKGQTALELKGKTCLRMLLNNEISNMTTKKQVDWLFMYSMLGFGWVFFGVSDKGLWKAAIVEISTSDHKHKA